MTMRIVALEEHFLTPEIYDAQGRAQPPAVVEQLLDVEDKRLTAMDASGVSVQVLSSAQPGVQLLEREQSVTLAQRLNDDLAEIIARHPDRYAGFASLPTKDPQAAARELERAVRELGLKGAMIHGHTDGEYLDDERFSPIFESAQALAVPIYLHPTRPTEQMLHAYFSGLEAGIARALSTNAWGWHVETGMHALRLVATGVFDRFPDLQMILGHMGEGIPFSLARADAALGPVTGHLERRVAEYFRENFYLTTSGYVTAPPLLCALMVFGADRILFSIDYPFNDNAVATSFLESAPIAAHDREKIAHLNAEKLLGV